MAGILGLETAPFIADRIFDIMDNNKDEIVNFEDFLAYLNIIINGTEKDKVMLSFEFLDKDNKGELFYNDIE